MFQQYKPINIENAAENPNSDEEIEDELRKLKQKLEEAIGKKEANKREQKIIIRNGLLKLLAEVEADDTDVADYTSNLQVPSTVSQLGSTYSSVSVAQLEDTPKPGQLPVQRTIPQPQRVPLQGLTEHGANTGEQIERHQVHSELQPGGSIVGRSAPTRELASTEVCPSNEPWTQVKCLETSGKPLESWININKKHVANMSVDESLFCPFIHDQHYI